MDYTNITYEVKDRIAWITLNRADKLNTLTNALMFELCDAAFKVQNDPDVGLAIITGAGDKAFSAGADIAELSRCDATSGTVQSRRGQDVFDLLETLWKPVIAVVNGYAFGGGCELAMACTLRIASENAVFALPEVKLGLIPGYGGTQRLPKIVGRGRALEYIMTGRRIDAQEALRAGLVNRVVPQKGLHEEAEKFAREILANAPIAVRYAMEAVNRGIEGSPKEGQMLESTYFGLCFATTDVKEGVKAFGEKRAAKFEGK